MKTNLKILVATDYSEAATNAVKYALQFAADTNSEITFLHVYKASATYPAEFTSLERFDDSPIEYETRELDQHIDEIIRSFKFEQGKFAHKCFVRQGHAGEQICEEAIYSKADMIIVGTHGATELHQIFLGSHTWDVIKKASIPVLAIPGKAIYNGVHNFVLGTEFRTGELPVIKFLVNWIKSFNGKLELFHINNDVFSEEFERELMAKFKDEVHDNIPDEKLSIRMINNPNIIDGVNDFCEKSKSSWLVMSPEKSHLFEKLLNPVISTTKKMSFYTHVPMLTLPDYTSPYNHAFWNKAKEQLMI
jgi:nucleotide-binding universal stress UspA family protein